MSDDFPRIRNRLAEVTFDEKTIPRGDTQRDHERAAAAFDLIDDNHFAVPGRDDGPYNLHIAGSELRLSFDVRAASGAPVLEFSVSMTPFRPLIKDYFQICESYFSAIRGAGAREIAEIDRARTALHNEGAALLVQRLADKAEIDEATARRLFTLVSVLLWRP